jgi:hypothetical protein
MTIHNISAYLQCFDAVDPPIEPPPVNEKKRELEKDAAAAPGAAAQSDVESIRRNLEEAFAARLQTERDEHARALLLAREQWTREEARTLGERLMQALEAGLAELRADVARVMTPFVSREIAEKSLEELICAARRAIADENAPVVSLAGPADLVEKVQLALGAEKIAAIRIESDAVDVRVDLRAARLETRLGAWMSRLAKAERDG